VLWWGRDGGGAGPFEDFETGVAAALDPLVVLLGEHRSDQADKGVTVREDPDHVGAAADLLSGSRTRHDV
jgi:hypothetical protein